MKPVDFTILAALFNFLSMIGNLFWSFKLNSTKGSNEIITYWKGKCDEKDDEMKELKEDIKRLHVRLGVYQKYHNHKPLA